MKTLKNTFNKSLSKKLLATVLLLLLATSQANAFSFSSLFSIFNTKKTTKKSGLSFASKAILSIVGASAIALIAYFWPKGPKKTYHNNDGDQQANTNNNTNTSPIVPIKTSKEIQDTKNELLKHEKINRLTKLNFKPCYNEENDHFLFQLCRDFQSEIDKNLIYNRKKIKENLNVYLNDTIETPLEIVCKNEKNKPNADAFIIVKKFVEKGAIIRQEDIDATNNKEIKDYLIAEKEKQDPAKSQENTSSKNEQSLETKEETTTKIENKSTKKNLCLDDR